MIYHHILIRPSPIRSPSVMKEVFQKKNAWIKFFNKNSHRIRDVELETVVKILSCGLINRGFLLYRCSNRACEHTKKIPISCNCGKRAIDVWTEKTKICSHIVPISILRLQCLMLYGHFLKIIVSNLTI